MTDETRMRGLVSYYLDIEQELLVRKAFPKTSQNKKRIAQCEQELNYLRGKMDEEIPTLKKGL